MKNNWWRVAIYPFGYPVNPHGIKDAPLCPLCGPTVMIPWKPSKAVVTYQTEVAKGEDCWKCGVIK